MLNDDIIDKIDSFLSGIHYTKTSLISKSWHSLVSSDFAWRRRVKQELTSAEQPPKNAKGWQEYYKLVLLNSKYRDYSVSYNDANKLKQVSKWELRSFSKEAVTYDADIWLARLLALGAEVDKYIIEQAFIENALHCIQLLVSKKIIDLNKKDLDKIAATYLHYAVYYASDKNILKVLLEQASNIICLPHLHLAAATGNTQTLSNLISQRVDVQLKDKGECTALWWALVNGQTECAKLLIQVGAKFNKIAYENILARCEYRSSRIDIDLSTALSAAIWSKNITCLSLIQPYRSIMLSDIHLEKSTQTASTLLIKANFADGLKLCSKEIAIIKPNKDGYTLFHVAIEYNSLQALNYLIEQKPDQINTVYTRQNTDDRGDHYIIKQTPLVQALFYRRLEAAKMLLEAEADPAIIGHFTCYDRSNRYVPCTDHVLIPLKELLKDKKSLEIFGFEATIQLLQILLQKTKYCRVTQIFLKEEALIYWLNQNLQQEDVQPLLIKVTELLIDQGADVNQREKYSKEISLPNPLNTPLHLAVSLGNKQLITLLLERQADSKIKNAKGQTAFDITADTSLLQLRSEQKDSKESPVSLITNLTLM